MIAQSITPILVGFLIHIKDKYDILFIYALIAMIIAAVIFIFFKEKKGVKIESKKGFDSFDN
jgi:hypothetical protein